MKIGFDFRMGGSINAGIGRYSFELLTHLLKTNLAKHEYVIFYHRYNCSKIDIETLRKLGAKLVEANFRHYSFGEQFLFLRLLNQYQLDLMHFPNFNVPILYRRKFVVTIHDMVHHKISGHKKSRYLKFLAYKYIISQAAKRAEQIITVTEAAKKEIIHYLGTAPEKIVVTYEAPSSEKVAEYDFNKLRKLLLLNRPYLLFFGTLERKKNIVKLCQGFDRFLEKYKFEIDLVLAGKLDPHYPEIKNQAMQIKHKDNLVFTGFVENDKQASLYRRAYAFITASLHEGFGLPGVEAMQYGLPVLASNTEVFNEVYDNAAIFFDPLNIDDIADKINLLVRDSQFHAQMQKKSFERANLFDWATTAEQTLTVYENCLSGNTLNQTKVFSPEPEIES